MANVEKSAPRVQELRARHKQAGLRRCELWVPSELVGVLQAVAKRLRGQPSRHPLLLTPNELDALASLNSDDEQLGRVIAKARALKTAASVQQSARSAPVPPVASASVLSMHRALLALLPPKARAGRDRPEA